MIQFHGRNRIRNPILISLLAAHFLQPAALAWPAQDAATLQKQAVERIDRYVEHFRKTGDLKQLAPELEKAAIELTESGKAFLARNDLASAALNTQKIGVIERMRGKSQSAMQFFQTSLDLARKARHDFYQAKALHGMAVTGFYNLQEYSDSLKHADEAIQLLARGREKKDLADALCLKCELHVKRRELPAAAESCERAYAAAVESNDPMALYYAFFDRADVHAQFSQTCDAKRGFALCHQALDRAQADLEQSLRIIRRLEYNKLAQETEGILRRMGYQRTMLEREAKSAGFNFDFMFHPKKPGDVVVSEKFFEDEGWVTPELKPLVQELVRLITSDVAGPNLEEIMKKPLAEPSSALASYLRMVKSLEADRLKLRDERGRAGYLEDKVGSYHWPILYLLNQRQYAEAFDLMERSRSRVLADLLRTGQLKFTDPTDRKMYADAVSLNARQSNLQKDLFLLRGSGDRVNNAERIASLEQEIQRLESEYAKLLKNGSGSKLQELAVSKPASLAELQRSMQRENYETLCYLIHDSQVVLWHISADAVHAQSVVLFRNPLINKVSGLRKSLTDRNVKFDEQTARELFLFLIQPALQWIKSDRLVILPHDDLNYIPFQALIAPDGRALGERFSISYAPSATVLLRMKKAENLRTGRLLAVADPSIVEAGREVAAIGKLYPQNSRVISNTLVKESDLKTMLGGYNLVHLSVHGKFNTQEPLLSHLKLEPGGADDGQLTAAEMFGLPLANARLVVLSACDTGQAQATRANEVIGMVRALLYAGAGNIVLSSWEVDAASTALWMETFYREAQTKSPVEAARAALIAVKRDPRYSHPYFWSPFLLIGR